MRLAVGLVTCALACGRVGFDPMPPDASSSARCTSWGPFGAPSRIAAVSTEFDDWSPTLTPDGSALYISSWDGSSTFSFGRWEVAGDTYSNFVRYPAAVGPGQWALNPAPAGDGSQVFVTLEELATGSNFIGVATSDGAGGYGSAQIIAELVSAGYNHSPWLSRDQLRLYYTSSLVPPSATDLDIYMTMRASVTDTWSAPALVPGVQSSSDDDGATLTSDELEIVFMSKRPDGLGGFDLWDATRATTSDAFGSATLLDQLDTPADDVDPRFGSDDSTLYYARDTNIQGNDNADVWIATRACLAH
jgi:hypothetical protein